MIAPTCPECQAELGSGFEVHDITTDEDEAYDLERYVLRCQVCGLAQAFVAHLLPAQQCSVEQLKARARVIFFQAVKDQRV